MWCGPAGERKKLLKRLKGALGASECSWNEDRTVVALCFPVLFDARGVCGK